MVLSRSEYEVLRDVCKTNGVSRIDAETPERQKATRILVQRGLIEINSQYLWSPTPSGFAALADYEEIANQKAAKKAEAEAHETAQRLQIEIDKKKQFRHDFKVVALGAFLTASLSAVFNYFFPDFIALMKRFIDILISLFEQS